MHLEIICSWLSYIYIYNLDISKNNPKKKFNYDHQWTVNNFKYCDFAHISQK